MTDALSTSTKSPLSLFRTLTMETCISRKRSRPNADDVEVNINPRKKHKGSAIIKSESKEPEETTIYSHFLERFSKKFIDIDRVTDDEPFEGDDDEDYNEDKSKKMKFTVLSPPLSQVLPLDTPHQNENGLLLSPNYVQLSDILKFFKYSATTTPTLYQTKRQFIEDLSLYLKRNCINHPIDSFYTKFRGKVHLSEKGFCIFLLIMRDFDQINKYVQHFVAYRYFC